MLIEKPEDLDKELSDVQSKNKGHGYDEPETKTEKKPADGGDDDKGKGGDAPNDDKGDDKGGSPEKPPKESDKKDDKGEEAGTRSDEEGVEPPKRSERHIPIPQYQDEKREWEKDKGVVDQVQKILGTTSREETLKKLNELGKTATKPEDTPKQITDKKAALKAYAEKHGVSEESVMELAEILGSGEAKLSDEDRKAIASAAKVEQDRKEQEYFDSEWTDHAMPVIDRKWPNATAEQKAKAKKLLDDISHTKGFGRTPLPIIINGYEDKEGNNPFEAIFGEQGNAEPPKGKRTMESGKPGGGKAAAGLTAKDLNSAKADKLGTLFEELEALPDDEKGKIVSDLEPMTYDRYVRFLGSRELDQGVTVSRDGRKVTLK